MTTLRTIWASAAAAAFLAAGPALAESAHTHGHGQFNLAIEGKTVEMEVMAPADDIVGFEHAPKTDAEKAKLEAAVASLKDGASLFLFPSAAGCKLDEVEVETDLDKDRDHAEFHAHYHFECDDVAALKYVEVALFKRFPSLSELEAAAITPSGQKGAELNRSANRLNF